MANNQSGVIGVLRALLTSDNASFDTSMRKSAQVADQTQKSIGGLGKEVAKLTPQAERMAKALGGERLLASANNLAAAVQRVGGASKLTEAQQIRTNATVTEAIAKYKALGQVAPESLLALQKATSGGLLGSIRNLVGSLGPLGPAITAAFSATAVVGFAKAVAGTADSLMKLRDQTGISLQGLQKIQRVGDDVGNSVEDVTSAIGQLQRRLGDDKPAADFTAALARLGLTQRELLQLDPFAQLDAIAGAFKSITDPAERANLAVSLFGRGGIIILPTLTKGFAELRGQIVGMSDDTVENLDEAGDAVTKFARIVEDAAGSVLSHAIDFIFPFRAAVREAQDAQKFLEEQQQKRGAAVGGLLAPKGLPQGPSADELTRIAAELTDKVRELISAEQKLLAISARAFGLDTIDNMREMVKAIGGMSGLIRMDATQLSALNKLTTEAIDAAKRNGQQVPLEWFRIEEATRSNVGTLQEYVKLAGELPEVFKAIPEPPQLIPFTSELDIERTRKLLAANAPGSGPFKQVGTNIGETVGAEIQKKLLNAFEDIPHFLTSSLLHSGGFLNGLKALGVSMADAIAEPLLKELALKLGGARVASTLSTSAGFAGAGFAGAGVLGGGGVGAATTTGSVFASGGMVAGGTAAGVAAGTGTVAASGPGLGTGAAAASGSAGGFSVTGLLTNPWTIGIGVGILFGTLAWKKGWFGLNKGGRANDARDKDLAQFAGFDTAADKADTANPPGFHGTDRFLTKYGHHDWFQALIRATDPKGVRAAWAPIQAFAGSLGRNVKSFNLGGFVPPNVVQPAILHGGSMGEVIMPVSRLAEAQPSSRNVYLNVEIRALDGADVGRVFRKQIIPELKTALSQNTDYLTSHAKKVIDS